MTRARHPGLMALMILGVLIGFLFLTAPQKAIAQEKADSAKTGAKVTQSAEAKANAAQDEPLMGPEQPRQQIRRPSKAQSPKQRAKTTRTRGIPEPTVVLKPGEVPAIKFDTLVYDFGRMRSGPDIVHDFWFTNTGSGTLEILKVRPP